MDILAKESIELRKEENAPEYRDRLRTWLIKMINSGKIPGLMWENSEKTVFRMPWKHAGRQDYNLEEDSKIFMAWAKHSGRYREGIDKPEPIVWKTRLRCALNKMPDIQELPNKSRLDVSEPYRVYELLPPVHKASQIRRRMHVRSVSQDINSSSRGEPSSSSSSHQQVSGTNINIPSPFSSSAAQRDTIESGLPRAAFAARHNNSTINIAQRFGAAGQGPTMPGSGVMSATHPWFTPPVSMPNLHHNYMQMDFGAPGRDAGSFLSAPLHPNFPHYPIVPPLTHHLGSMLTGPSLAFGQNMTYPLPAPRSNTRSSHSSFGVRSLLGEANIDDSPASSNQNVEQGHSDTSKDDSSAEHLPDLGSLNLDRISDLSKRLEEYQQRIETLEQDVTRYRDAHAREREARRKLEVERENMNTVLERMGEGLRMLAVQWPPSELERLSPTDKRIEEVSEQSEAKKGEFPPISRIPSSHTDVSGTSRNPSASSCFEPETSEDAYLKVAGLHACYNVDGRGSSASHSSREEPLCGNRKRGPIDLSMSSPVKFRRFSDENVPEQHVPYEAAGSERKLVRPHSSPETPDDSYDRRELFQVMSGGQHDKGQEVERSRSRSLTPSRQASMLNVFRDSHQPRIQVT